MIFLLVALVFCLGLYLLSKTLNYLYILWVCLGIYFLAMQAPYPSDDNPFFYLICSSWSALIILLVFIKERTILVAAIIGIELMAILVNLVSINDGLTANKYNTMLDNLTMLEWLVLVIGMPCNGIYNGILSNFGIYFYRNAHTFRLHGSHNRYKVSSNEEKTC